LGKQNQNFSTDKPDEDDYQIELNIAIASGKIYGLSWKKCSEELLPQSLILFMPL
jgi:cell division protein FtsW